MAPFPILLGSVLSPLGAFLVYLLIGFAFGYVLEIAGFGNSKKLAAQFYFTELTVLKVMFTAIIVAMVLIYGASAVGLLDINLIWINPTYLWPGIVGGLIMGVGFILGGFCPGTSIVAAATAKIDGIFFVLGAFFGIFLFGETVDLFDVFWNSSYMGRFTLDEWLGIPTGWVVLGVVFMALFMFWGGEQLERIFGGKEPGREPKMRFVGAAALVGLALVVLAVGQPTVAERWEKLAPVKEAELAARTVQLQPAEVLHIMHDHKLKLVILDVRDEADFNLFHLAEAQRLPQEGIEAIISDLQLSAPNTVFLVTSNDETAATAAWKVLLAQSVPNVYILDGGINEWLRIFASDDPRIQPIPGPVPDDSLAFTFEAALGAAYHCAEPDPDLYDLEYEERLKLELKRGPTGGGCG
ncbi:MAG: sulfurtransferase [Anaerolineales bacterium]|nr:MAG: sulfurtransferase [Anaerolineales bacterium]